MEPIALILTALAAGVTSAVQEPVKMAAKDAYDYLKGLVKRKLEENGDNDAVPLIDNPDEQNKPLLEARLKEAGIDKMPDVIAAANKVTVICRPHINTAPYLENYQSLLQQSPLIRIQAPDKMGKTRLVNHIFDSFNSEHYQKVKLSMEDFDTEDKAKSGILLYRFCQEIKNQLSLPHSVRGHWESIRDGGNKSKCTSYFEHCLLTDAKSPIVIVIDDLNSLTSYDSTYKDLCSLLRSFYNMSAPSSEKYREKWKKLGLIIAYSGKPLLPERDSPFNVGKLIQLPEFTVDEVQSLAMQYKIQMDSTTISLIMRLVGGHPHLISLSFEHLRNINLNSQEDINNFITQSSTQRGIYSEHLNKLHRKIQYDQLKQALYRVVRSQDPVRLNSQIVEKLEEIGLIKSSGTGTDFVEPFCELYRVFFNSIIK